MPKKEKGIYDMSKKPKGMPPKGMHKMPNGMMMSNAEMMMKEEKAKKKKKKK